MISNAEEDQEQHEEGTSINMPTTVEEDIEAPVEEGLYCYNCKRRQHSTTN